MSNFDENNDSHNWKILEMEANHEENANERNVETLKEKRKDIEELTKENGKLEMRVKTKRNQLFLLQSNYDLIQKKLTMKRNQERATKKSYDPKQSELIERTKQISAT